MANDDPRLTSDVSAFDFDKSTDDSWRAFAARLAEVISVMDAGATLCIGAMSAGPSGQPPYVTFTCAEGGRLMADAARTGPLEADAVTAPDALARLARDGWIAVADADGDPAAVLRREGSQEDALTLASTATDALRHAYGVQHPALLAPDQLADILTPTPVEQPAPDPEPGRIDPILTATRAELDAALLAELTVLLGHEPLRDTDGDFAIRVGSTMVFLRPSVDGDEVIVFAPLVHDVEGRSRAMEILSDLNTEARWVRFLLIRDRVFVSLSVLADPLIPRHLHRAFRIVSLISDNIDEQLADKLRGRTTFD